MRIVQVSYGNKSNLVQTKQKMKRHWKTDCLFLTDVRFVIHALSVILVTGTCLAFLKKAKLKTLQGKKDSTGEVNSDRALTESDMKS